MIRPCAPGQQSGERIQAQHEEEDAPERGEVHTVRPGTRYLIPDAMSELTLPGGAQLVGRLLGGDAGRERAPDRAGKDIIGCPAEDLGPSR